MSQLAVRLQTVNIDAKRANQIQKACKSQQIYGNHQRIKEEICKSQHICKLSENLISQKDNLTRHQPHTDSGSKSNTFTPAPPQHTPHITSNSDPAAATTTPIQIRLI
jgi:hypothetical protein